MITIFKSDFTNYINYLYYNDDTLLREVWRKTLCGGKHYVVELPPYIEKYNLLRIAVQLFLIKGSVEEGEVERKRLRSIGR